MTIGMSWAKGLVSYVDVFDHKGPFIFFVNMLGFKFAGDKTGVFVVQLCFMIFTAIFLLKMAKLGEKSVFFSVLLTCFTISCLYIPLVADSEYWYEDGVRQGYDADNSAYRGEEIYDQETDSWYWLDNVQKGAKAKDKDVYLDTLAGEYAENKDTGTGKLISNNP